jgi:hypothetical protein
MRDAGEQDGALVLYQPDAFGPQWMFGINIAPVVENLFARILK